MSGDVVRFGLIGTGMMGIEHVLNLRLRDDAQLVAAADPHEASRRRARDAAGPGLALYEDARAMLEREPLDAVIVATPNHTHAAVLEDVFVHDLHVLVEKPLCTTLEEVVGRGGPAPVSTADGRRAVAMGVAGERSIALGRPVELDELRPSFSAPARA